MEEQELEAVQIAEEIVGEEEQEQESTSKASATADVSLVYKVQKNASASVNLTQSVSTEGEWYPHRRERLRQAEVAVKLLRKRLLQRRWYTMPMAPLNK